MSGVDVRLGPVREAAARPVLQVSDRLPAAHPLARLQRLTDPGTLRLLAGRDGGVLAAEGLVDGRAIAAFACDPTRGGGALGPDAGRAVSAAVDRGLDRDCPVVGVWHSGGAGCRTV